MFRRPVVRFPHRKATCSTVWVPRHNWYVYRPGSGNVIRVGARWYRNPASLSHPMVVSYRTRHRRSKSDRRAKAVRSLGRMHLGCRAHCQSRGYAPGSFYRWDRQTLPSRHEDLERGSHRPCAVRPGRRRDTKSRAEDSIYHADLPSAGPVPILHEAPTPLRRQMN